MVWKINGIGSPIVEVWEDFKGNLWFVAERLQDTQFEKDNEICFGYSRLYHMPEFAEWGTFSIKEIKDAYGNPHMVWPVKEINWSNIDTYEEGLLVYSDE